MKSLLLALTLVLFGGVAALAQDAGQIGITLGYPSGVGIVWHVTDSVGVRPDISFSNGSTESPAIRSGIAFLDESVGSGESSSTAVTVGVSGLLYLGKWDKLRAYVSPRYAYGRLTSNSGTTFAVDNKNTTQSVTGSFGAQYQIHRRFAVFGETGFGYTRSRTTFTSLLLLPVIPVGPNVPAPVSRSESITSRSWGTRSGAGVIFYFK